MPGVNAYTALMLHLDGLDASVNLVDSSPHAHVVTPAGNAQADTAQYKFDGGAAGLFDGLSYLAVTDSSIFTIGVNNITLDCWIRPTNASGDQFICGHGTDNSNRLWLQLYSNNVYFTVLSGGSPVLNLIGTIPISNGVWYHLAVTRVGSTWRLFVNGVLDTSGSYGAALPDYTSSFIVGAGYDTSGKYYGHIDELRFQNGEAAWSADFALASEPYSTEETPYYGVNDYTAVLLHLDGLHQSTSIEDSGPNALTVSLTGPSIYGHITAGRSVFGGAGLYLGAGAYLSIADTPALTFGANDFTFDCRMRFDSMSGDQVIFEKGHGASDKEILVYVQSGQIVVGYSTDGSNFTYRFISWTHTTGTWYHFALVRHGTDLLVFIDGILLGSPQVISGTLFDAGADFVIGAKPGIGAYFNGQIDEVRVQNGQAYWTSEFSIPTGPYAVYVPPPPPPPPPPFRRSSSANRMRVKNSQGVFIDVGVNFLEQLRDVDISYPQPGDILFFDGQFWQNVQLTTDGTLQLIYDEQNKLLILTDEISS